MIDWNAKRIRACQRPLDFEGRKRNRDRMLEELLGRGIVEITPPEVKARRGRSATGVDAVATDGILRVKQTARLLHIVRELDE